MSDEDFDWFMSGLGYDLKHWPSGKLFRPLNYYEIKALVLAVLGSQM